MRCRCFPRLADRTYQLSWRQSGTDVQPLCNSRQVGVPTRVSGCMLHDDVSAISSFIDTGKGDCSRASSQYRRPMASRDVNASVCPSVPVHRVNADTKVGADSCLTCNRRSYFHISGSVVRRFLSRIGRWRCIRHPFLCDYVQRQPAKQQKGNLREQRRKEFHSFQPEDYAITAPGPLPTLS
ncbi:hypothetical protein D3C72_1154720 [compost metagenome]